MLEKLRLAWKYPLQEETATVDVYSDSNYARCQKSRKSTSGGCVLIGGHLIRTYSKTQGCVTLTSAGAELLAATTGGCEAIGMVSMLGDVGIEAVARLHVDAAAALGVVQRKGVSWIRHLDMATLWLQEQEARRRIETLKVLGSEIQPTC